MTDVLSLALERTENKDNELALTSVGGVVGDWTITDRVKPCKRWLYIMVNVRTGDIKHLRGYEVVRLARRAGLNGLAVIMPGCPWVSHEAVA